MNKFIFLIFQSSKWDSELDCKIITINILNKKKTIKFTSPIKRQKKLEKYNICDIRNLIYKVKQVNNIEMLCALYTLFFFGLNFYQLSKLSYNNYNQKK